MKTFIFYWLDGKIDRSQGETVQEAFTALGYGNGALRALDHWEELKEDATKKEPISQPQITMKS